MLERTHIPEAPWHVVQAVDKKKARLNCISASAGTSFPYQEVAHPPVESAMRACGTTTTFANPCRRT
jgi:hypothetical protein